jgi:hypothetical protein
MQVLDPPKPHPPAHPRDTLHSHPHPHSVRANVSHTYPPNPKFVLVRYAMQRITSQPLNPSVYATLNRSTAQPLNPRATGRATGRATAQPRPRATGRNPAAQPLNPGREQPAGTRPRNRSTRQPATRPRNPVKIISGYVWNPTDNDIRHCQYAIAHLSHYAVTDAMRYRNA